MEFFIFLKKVGEKKMWETKLNRIVCKKKTKKAIIEQLSDIFNSGKLW